MSKRKYVFQWLAEIVILIEIAYRSMIMMTTIMAITGSLVAVVKGDNDNELMVEVSWRHPWSSIVMVSGVKCGGLATRC